MKLEEKLLKIAKTSTLDRLPSGAARDFDELWENLIEPRLPKEEAIYGWHKILMEYVNKDDAVFFMRAFGGPSGDSSRLRRGFYNKTNANFSCFYGDNFFTSYFFSMALDGYVPELEDFIEVISKNKKFPCGYIQTKEEQKYAIYKKGKNSNIQNKGYKIAHIFSSGQDYNNETFSKISEFCYKYFPRGEQIDWSADCARKINFVSEEDKTSARKFLVAHFLRTVHPINYFLVPKKSNTKDKQTGKVKTNIYYKAGDGRCLDEIGENIDLINYVKDKIAKKYPIVYKEFLAKIYPREEINANLTGGLNKQIDAKYGIDLWKSSYCDETSLCMEKDIEVAKEGIFNRKATGRNPEIKFFPVGEEEFKNELLNKKRARFLLTYETGVVKESIWKADSFDVKSNLRGNIQSRPFWRKELQRGLLRSRLL